MGFEPWMLAAMDDSGFNGITDEHIRRVAGELQKIGWADIDRQTFDRACYAVGIDPENFTQENLNELEDVLNGD